MVLTTPFHPRLSQLNTTGLYGHWSGYLSTLRYDLSAKHEYFGIRNSAGVFDTSPLYKYWIRGRDAESFLAGVMSRDVRSCRPGRAQYTVWCDDAGYVLEDGVLFRHGESEFLLTCARPNFGYFADLIGRLEVQLEDVTADFGILAVQGPRSRDILARLTPEVSGLPFFALTPATIGAAAVTISRTGYTGDLGFEVFVRADDAIAVLDAVLAAGVPYGLRPFGEDALLMARIEAGLVLIDVDFSSSRFAYTDQQRVTPIELGLGWMLRGIDADDRPFIGRNALRREIAEQRSRWSTVGLVLDWQDWNRLHAEAGLIAPKHEQPLAHECMVYENRHEETGSSRRAGYATSLMYSPVLQKHIAIARLRPALGTVGTRVFVEVTIDHENRTVAAEVAKLPLFNPERKTA
jgi:glycine cleavage system T protein (aminomethyltransferase)